MRMQYNDPTQRWMHHYLSIFFIVNPDLLLNALISQFIVEITVATMVGNGIEKRTLLTSFFCKMMHTENVALSARMTRS